MTDQFMAPLPTVALPKSDEPVMGLITRLADSNGYPHLSWLTAISDLRKQHLHVVATRQEAHPKLDHLSRLSADDFAQISYHPAGADRVRYFHLDIRKPLVLAKYRKACPLCLNESLYHRAFWDLTPITICHKHGIRLIDKCYTCSAPLGWGPGQLIRCKCGSNILHSPRHTMAEEFIAPVRTVAARLGLRPDGDRLNNRLFGTLDAGELLWLMLNLASFCGSGKMVTAHLVIRRRAETIHEALRVGYEALLDWPVSFERYLDQVFRAGHPQGTGTVSLNAQRLSHWLAKEDCWPDVTEAIRDAVWRYSKKRNSSSP